ncbi:MAG TPA: DUF1499 domain-containing protein, partial [Planctomycetaceae bacterium]|nr:DUF1499 domain-containing protein [Planctomycetaceae bacterium]
MLTGCAIMMLIIVVGTAGLFLLSFTAQRPANLGVRNGQLSACPDSPNCVSTQAEDREHWIAPFAFEQDPDTVIDTLRIYSDMMGSRIEADGTRTFNVRVKPDAMRAALGQGYATATDLADYLVKKGL